MQPIEICVLETDDGQARQIKFSFETVLSLDASNREAEMSKIVVYGADWCSLTQEALAHLKQLNVDHRYVNIDHDREAAKWVAKQNHGKEKKPTLDIDGEVLSEPSDGEIDEVLAEKGLL